MSPILVKSVLASNKSCYCLSSCSAVSWYASLDVVKKAFLLIDNPVGMWMEILIAYHVCISEWVDSLTLLSSISLQVSHAKTLFLIFFLINNWYIFQWERKRACKWRMDCTAQDSCEFQKKNVCNKFSECFSTIKKYFDDVNSFQI